MWCVKAGGRGVFANISPLVVEMLTMLTVSFIVSFLPLIGRRLVHLLIAALPLVLFVVGLPCRLPLCRAGWPVALLCSAFGVIVSPLALGITSLGLVLIDLLVSLGLLNVVLRGGVGP